MARFGSGAGYYSDHPTANQNDVLMLFFYNDASTFCLQSEEFPVSNKLQKLQKLHLSCTDSPRPPGGVNLLVWLGILRAQKWNLLCVSADNEPPLGTNLTYTSRGSLETLDRLVTSLQGVSRSGGLTWFSRELRAPAGRWEEERSLVSTWLLQHLHTGGINGRPV